MELNIKDLLFLIPFIYRGSSCFFCPCLKTNAKLFAKYVWFWKLGRRKWVCRSEEHAVVLAAFWKFHLDFRNLKSFMIMFILNGLWFSWNWQFLPLPLHPEAHQAVISQESICVHKPFFSILYILVFIDFCDLEKMLIESTEGLEVTTVRENIWTKSLYHLQDCNCWLSSSCCWLIFVVLLNNKNKAQRDFNRDFNQITKTRYIYWGICLTCDGWWEDRRLGTVSVPFTAHSSFPLWSGWSGQKEGNMIISWFVTLQAPLLMKHIKYGSTITILGCRNQVALEWIWLQLIKHSEKAWWALT